MYLSIYLILLILSLLSINANKRYIEINNKKIFVICAIILTIIAGIRVEVGTDYDTYKNIFYNVNSINDYDYLEIGFRATILFIKLIFNHEMIFFVFFATITMLFFSKGIYSNSLNQIFSLFLFYSVFYTPYVFNVIRQGVTMSLFIFSLSYFDLAENKKNFYRVLFITCIATLFHFSGMFILIAYLIYNYKYLLNQVKKYLKWSIPHNTKLDYFKNINNYLIYWIIIFSSLFLVIYNPITNILLAISPRFNSYAESFTDSVDIISLSQRLFLIMLITIFLPKLVKSYPKIINLYHVYLFGYVIYLTFSSTEIVAARINMFFRILEILIIPYIIHEITNKYVRYMVFLIIALWCLMLLVLQIKSTHIYPYNCIF